MPSPGNISRSAFDTLIVWPSARISIVTSHRSAYARDEGTDGRELRRRQPRLRGEMSKALRRGLPMVLALAAVLSISQPALGYVETKTKGTVGVHSLTDTFGSPGATCAYMP